jgi:CO/xanthine dehydrogenase Mo-binding subunit
MTRKDYIVIASALRDAYQKEENKCAAQGESTRTNMQALETASCSIAAALQIDNDRFNREHFLAVVRGEKALMSRPSRS